MADAAEGLLIGKGTAAAGPFDVHLLPQMANRHGLVAGATGTGKTVSLQVLAEAFSSIGVPVFAADIKGDLSGVSQPGGGNDKVDKRIEQLGLAPWDFHGAPVMFWDVFGEQGHPVRTTVSEVGPLLLSRMLSLNEIQEAVLTVAFRVADDNGLLLLDMDDLRSMLKYVADNADDIGTTYGNVSAASVGAIQRALLNLEEQGGKSLFGEPALDLFDFMQTDANGKGYINILAADKLMLSPHGLLDAAALAAQRALRAPARGRRPRQAQARLLLRRGAPAVHRLAAGAAHQDRAGRAPHPQQGRRRVLRHPEPDRHPRHGARPARQQGAARAARLHAARAEGRQGDGRDLPRRTPSVDVEKAVTDLAVGEALLSVLEADGSPSMVQRAFVVPPHGHIGAIAPEQRQQVMTRLAGRRPLRAGRSTASRPRRCCSAARRRPPTPPTRRRRPKPTAAEAEAAKRPAPRPESAPAPKKKSSGGGYKRQGMAEALGKSVLRAAGSEAGRRLVRGMLGSLLKR